MRYILAILLCIVVAYPFGQAVNEMLTEQTEAISNVLGTTKEN